MGVIGICVEGVSCLVGRARRVVGGGIGLRMMEGASLKASSRFEDCLLGVVSRLDHSKAVQLLRWSFACLYEALLASNLRLCCPLVVVNKQDRSRAAQLQLKHFDS